MPTGQLPPSAFRIQAAAAVGDRPEEPGDAPVTAEGEVAADSGADVAEFGPRTLTAAPTTAALKRVVPQGSTPARACVCDGVGVRVVPSG